MTIRQHLKLKGLDQLVIQVTNLTKSLEFLVRCSDDSPVLRRCLHGSGDGDVRHEAVTSEMARDWV